MCSTYAHIDYRRLKEVQELGKGKLEKGPAETQTIRFSAAQQQHVSTVRYPSRGRQTPCSPHPRFPTPAERSVHDSRSSTRKEGITASHPQRSRQVRSGGLPACGAVVRDGRGGVPIGRRGSGGWWAVTVIQLIASRREGADAVVVCGTVVRCVRRCAGGWGWAGRFGGCKREGSVVEGEGVSG